MCIRDRARIVFGPGERSAAIQQALREDMKRPVIDRLRRIMAVGTIAMPLSLIGDLGVDPAEFRERLLVKLVVTFGYLAGMLALQAGAIEGRGRAAAHATTSEVRGRNLSATTAESTRGVPPRVESAKAEGMAEERWSVEPDTRAPADVVALAEQIERDGGRTLALYQEPMGRHWQIFCILPLEKVEATPYQRDLSPTHAKRLQEVVKKLDRFVDPVLVTSPRPGVYWTPNGNHRRVALVKLKRTTIPAIVIPDSEVSFQILALNTEKAHNLKEKSLEVIRMYRVLAEEAPKSGEDDFAFQFESPHLITLGLLYERNKRFAGGAFAPILKRVDKFLAGDFAKTLPQREERAELVRAADEVLGEAVAKLKKRGLNHPYVKNFLLARTTPLTRARKVLPSFQTTFTKLRENIEAFDLAKIRYEDVQRAAVVVPAAE